MKFFSTVTVLRLCMPYSMVSTRFTSNNVVLGYNSSYYVVRGDGEISSGEDTPKCLPQTELQFVGPGYNKSSEAVVVGCCNTTKNEAKRPDDNKCSEIEAAGGITWQDAKDFCEAPVVDWEEVTTNDAAMVDVGTYSFAATRYVDKIKKMCEEDISCRGYFKGPPYWPDFRMLWENTNGDYPECASLCYVAPPLPSSCTKCGHQLYKGNYWTGGQIGFGGAAFSPETVVKKSLSESPWELCTKGQIESGVLNDGEGCTNWDRYLHWTKSSCGKN